MTFPSHTSLKDGTLLVTFRKSWQFNIQNISFKQENITNLNTKIDYQHNTLIIKQVLPVLSLSFGLWQDETVEEIPEVVIQECAQLVKANSIQGNSFPFFLL